MPVSKLTEEKIRELYGKAQIVFGVRPPRAQPRVSAEQQSEAALAKKSEPGDPDRRD